MVAATATARAPEQRSDQNTPEVRFEARTRTLRGDIRDLVLREFKGMQRPWQQMTENEQSRLIQRANDIAGTVVRGAVDLVAEDGLTSLAVTVGKMTLEGGAIKGVYECYADDDSLLSIRRLQGKRAMFVLADPDEYFGQRAAAKPDNVGELAMPRGDASDEPDEPEASTDQAATETVPAEAATETVDPTTGEVTTAPSAEAGEDERLEAAIGEAEPVTPPSPPSAPAVDFEPDDEAAVMRRRQAVRPDASEEPRADEEHLAKVGRGGRRKAGEPAAQT